MTVELNVTTREPKAAVAENQVKGIVYGPKQEPIAVTLDKLAFEKTLQESGESTILTLTGLPDAVEVLIHDVAFNAARGGVEHVDFYAIERGKELTTNVPLEFVGEAPAEKDGATINKVLHDVEVTCRPSDLPGHIEVDLSVLDSTEAQIRVADLNVPEGVKVENDEEDVVANVAAAREEEPEEVGAVDMDAIEVESKGKEEDSADGGPAAEDSKE